MLRHFIFCVSCLIFLHSGLVAKDKPKKPVIHSILITDSSPDIRSAVQRNENMYEDLLNRIRNCGMRVRRVVHSKGENITSKKLLRQITKMNVRSNDAVIVYYHGHGMRSLKKGCPWPRMCMGGKKGIEVSQVITMVKRKAPRFFLVLSDCCNGMKPQKIEVKPLISIPGRTQTIDIQVDEYTVAMKKRLRRLFQALFIQSKGSVILSAARPGFMGYGSPFTGFFFTKSLKMAFELASFTPEKQSWERVVKSTDAILQGHFGQKPFYKLNVK